MLEMMLSGAKPNAVIPVDSGPGGSTLLFNYARNGSQLAGYFGRVSTTDLITADALSTLLGEISGTSANPTAGWLKFYIDGAVIFVAQACFKTNLRWYDVNVQQAVDGSRIVTIGNYKYKIRLLKGQLTPNDPSAAIVGSEWNRLMYSVLDGSTVGSCEIENGIKWDNLSYSEFGITGNTGVWSLCQEVFYRSDNPGAYRVYRGNSYNNYSQVGGVYSTTTDTRNGWRPVLEFVGPA